MTTFTYDSVTPEAIKSLVVELQAAGSTVTNPAGNSWAISGHGVKADALYDPARSKLTVMVQSKPFFVADSFINSGILKALGRA